MSGLSAHPRPLGHMSIGVRSYEISKSFFTAVLEPLGLRLVYDSEAKGPSSKEPRTLGYGPDEDHELLNIFEYGDEAAPPGKGCHIAFNAPTRGAVVQFHAAALRFGGTSNGEPGVRVNYGPNYFAAFVICPDGWRWEAVCKTPEET